MPLNPINQQTQKEGYEEIQRLTSSKPCCQPPTVSLTFVNDKIPFFGISCQSSFWSQFLGFILLLFCRINLDNRVLLVPCVDLLKMKFTISLSEFRVDHRFLLFLFQLDFSSAEPTEALISSSDPSQLLLLSAKCPIILPPDLRLNFLLKRTTY